MNWKEQLSEASWEINGSHRAVSLFVAKETVSDVIEKLIEDIPDDFLISAFPTKENNGQRIITAEELKQQLRDKWL